jgi:hypothetical protein
MNELIEAIRTAVADGATVQQKAAGVQACRTIATALDTEPGNPLTLPGVAPTPTTSRVSIDQVLDLAIARLSMVASEHESKRALATSPIATAQPTIVTNPRGFRVPIAPTSAIKVATRPASTGRTGQRTR